MSGEDSAYAALGLRPGARRAEVEQAYRRLIKLHHPDMAGGDAGRAAEINRAYTQLRRQGVGPPLRPRRNVPVPVPRSSPPRGRRTGLLLMAVAAAAVAAGLAHEDRSDGPGGRSYVVQLRPLAPVDPASESHSDLAAASFDEPLETGVIDRAITDAMKFHAGGDSGASAEYSRACHDRLRRNPSLTWFDSCAAFDEATVALGGSPAEESGRFDPASVTVRQMGAARMLSGDTLAADFRLRRIRSRVEVALVPRLDEAAAHVP